MRTMLGRTCLLALLLGGIVLGCHKQMVQQKQPADPLLMSKKPIEGREMPGDPVLTMAGARASADERAMPFAHIGDERRVVGAVPRRRPWNAGPLWKR